MTNKTDTKKNPIAEWCPVCGAGDEGCDCTEQDFMRDYFTNT